MQLGLLEYPIFQEWSSQHEPLERPVPLAEHPENFGIFNSWVELLECSRPTTAQTAVSMRNHPALVHADNVHKSVDCLVYVFCKQDVNVFVLVGRQKGTLLAKSKGEIQECLAQAIHQCAKMLARVHPGMRQDACTQ